MDRQNDVRAKLQDAAIAQFAAHGYDHVTAARIAAEAGVTERTFFRYYADKREVLFDGEGPVRDMLVQGIADALPTDDPLGIVRGAFRSLETHLGTRRDYAVHRHSIIQAASALQERERTKLAALVEAMAQALEQRGVARRQARLAADSGMAAYLQAFDAWVADSTTALGDHIDRSFEDLRSVLRSESKG